MEYADILNNGFPAADEEKKSELTAKLSDIVKALRSDFSGSEAATALFTSFGDEQAKDPILSEIRLLAEKILKNNPKNYDVIMGFSQIEEDDRIEVFLDKYSTSYDLSRDSILFERYLSRGDVKKFEPLRQKMLYKSLREAVSRQRFCSMRNVGEIEKSLEEIKACLGMIHTFEGEAPTPEHPVTCDGTPDCWIFEKVWHGLRISCREAALGRKEEALTALEDVIGLVENAVKLLKGAKIRRSRFLPELEWSKVVSEFDWGESFHFITENNCWTIPIDVKEVFDALNDAQGWAWFDTIRKEPRFTECVERARGMIVSGEG